MHDKFDCLICKESFIHELRSTLNVQSGSIRAKTSSFRLLLFLVFIVVKDLDFFHDASLVYTQ